MDTAVVPKSLKYVISGGNADQSRLWDAQPGSGECDVRLSLTWDNRMLPMLGSIPLLSPWYSWHVLCFYKRSEVDIAPFVHRQCDRATAETRLPGLL